jgi:hypothetical protein
MPGPADFRRIDHNHPAESAAIDRDARPYNSCMEEPSGKPWWLVWLEIAAIAAVAATAITFAMSW